MKNHHFAVGAFCLTALLAIVVSDVSAQNAPENLQFFPKDMTRAAVVSEMRHFAFALGVRCTHCHVRNENGQGMNFASDENPNKDKARFMLRMLETINEELLVGLSDRDNPPVEVTCKTCHRGTAKPRILGQEMLLAAHDGGGQAAVEKFEELRENHDNSGAYDFREWETNTVAERLAEAGNHEDALIVWRMNSERYPESTGIWVGIAESLEALDQIDEAIEAYEKVVALQPEWRAMVDKLAELKGE